MINYRFEAKVRALNEAKNDLSLLEGSLSRIFENESLYSEHIEKLKKIISQQVIGQDEFMVMTGELVSDMNFYKAWEGFGFIETNKFDTHYLHLFDKYLKDSGLIVKDKSVYVLNCNDGKHYKRVIMFKAQGVFKFLYEIYNTINNKQSPVLLTSTQTEIMPSEAFNHSLKMAARNDQNNIFNEMLRKI